MQMLIVALIVVGALVYLGRMGLGAVRSARRAREGACGASCGCGESGGEPATLRRAAKG